MVILEIMQKGEMQDKLRRRVGKTLKIFMRLLLV
jgi:hypothetical protein